jgi:hypothetical protein
MLTKTSWIRIMMATTAAITGCSSDSADEPSLRPGVNDSNQVYQGTPSASESAFWVAVRNTDDVARAAAVSKMTADVAADPTNGYSQFLIGASAFMPPSTLLRALRDGTPVPAFDIPTLEFGAGNFEEGGPRMARAAQNNFVATQFITVTGDLVMGDPVRAMEDLYKMLDYCNSSPIDRNGGDALAFVVKANAGALAQRECYSGYHAAHATSGELLILADLHAVNGNPQAARKYYDAIVTSSDFATFPLKPLVERRRSGAQATNLDSVTNITFTCATCHSNSLQ